MSGCHQRMVQRGTGHRFKLFSAVAKSTSRLIRMESSNSKNLRSRDPAKRKRRGKSTSRPCEDHVQCRFCGQYRKPAHELTLLQAKHQSWTGARPPPRRNEHRGLQVFHTQRRDQKFRLRYTASHTRSSRSQLPLCNPHSPHSWPLSGLLGQARKP